MNRSVEALATATRRRRERAESAVEKALKEARKTLTPVRPPSPRRPGCPPTSSTDTPSYARRSRPSAGARRDAVPGDAAHAPDIEAATSTLVRRLSRQLATDRRKHRQEVAQVQAALAVAHGELLKLRRQQQAGR